MIKNKKITLFKRQKQLLALLSELGGNASNLDFQKLLFLYCQVAESEPPYEFIPYHFGPFSFTSYADRRKLIERGLLAQDGDIWQLTDFGHQVVSETSPKSPGLADFVRRYRGLRGDSLVAETYRRYPYFGIYSEIADKVLNGEKAALQRIAAACPKRAAPGISTIGYEGRSLEAYLNILLEGGVTLLCDVRRNALSRKYGFSKGTLSKACEGVGIRYIHLPELGIASALRKNLVTQEDYDRLFDRYEREVLREQLATLERIKEWVQEGERVALTCYEHLPGQCHRHRVAAALEDHFGEDFAAEHL